MSLSPINDAEMQVIDSKVNDMMDWAKTRQAEAEQLALDATRLVACTADRFDSLKKQGFFKRCWNRFSGHNTEIVHANIDDLFQMQKVAFRYVNILQERELVLAHALLSIKNNLVSLALKDDETRKLVEMLAQRTAERFDKLENRVEQLEITTNLQGWLLGLEEREYDEKYPTQYMRLFRVINDFFSVKNDNWNYNDLIFMKKAIRTVGLNPKQKISMNDFIEHLTEEIQSAEVGFDAYAQAISQFSPDDMDNYSKFIIDNISSPVFVGMHCVKTQFLDRMDIVETLEEEMNIGKNEALKMLLNKAIANLNVNMQHELQLYDIAIEIMTSLRLSNLLIHIDGNQIKCQDTEEIQSAHPIEENEKVDENQAPNACAVSNEQLPNSELIKVGNYTYDIGRYKVGTWRTAQIKPKGQEDPEEIVSIACFNDMFYFLTQEKIYTSNDLIEFTVVCNIHEFEECGSFRSWRGDKLIVFDHKLFAVRGTSYFVYTEDGNHWAKSDFPGDFNSLDLKDVFLFDKKIIFLARKYTSYSYKVSGMIWDSTKSTSCYKPIILFGDNIFDMDINNIAKDWSRYEYNDYHSSYISTGDKLIFVLNDCIDNEELFIKTSDCITWNKTNSIDNIHLGEKIDRLFKFILWAGFHKIPLIISGEDVEKIEEVEEEKIVTYYKSLKRELCDSSCTEQMQGLLELSSSFIKGKNYVVYFSSDNDDCKFCYAPLEQKLL